MSIGLSGNLRDFGIADVFQLIGQQRKTGALNVRQHGNGALLLFDEGAVVSALPVLGDGEDPLAELLARSGFLRREQVKELCDAQRSSAQPLRQIVLARGWLSSDALEAAEDRFTRDTIFDVLRWEGGSFDFQPRKNVPKHSGVTRLGAEQILMDGLRMLDEWRTFAGRIPSEDAVFRRRPLAEIQPGNKDACSDAAEHLLGLVDGRLAARQIIDLSRLGNFEGTRLLASCVDAGLLERVEAPNAPPGWRAWAAPEQARHGLRAFAEVALSLLALFLVVVLQGASSGPPVTGSSWPIPLAAIERAAELEQMRELRKLAEVFQLLELRWPATLEELRARGLVDAAALASPRGRPYPSQGPVDGLVLLAPDP